MLRVEVEKRKCQKNLLAGIGLTDEGRRRVMTDVLKVFSGVWELRLLIVRLFECSYRDASLLTFL